MGVVVCPKHDYAGGVTCCRHVAAAIDRGQVFAGALHGPRKTFLWCACPACAAAPRMPFCGPAIQFGLLLPYVSKPSIFLSKHIKTLG